MADTTGFRAPPLGIGMIFSAALRPFLERRPDALDLLEIEPQTMWLADDPLTGPFREFKPGIEAFAALPGHKLVHSVGIPLGGTRAPDPGQMALVKATADRLHSPWVSEHLAVAGTPHRAAGFLLPPLQTDAGAETAVANIRAFSDGIGRPVAIETGVAYFRRKPFEMPDGDFIATVAQEADCGILLDLHNLWCNHVNGRIDWDETLSQIPLDRVWEVHLAGGDDMDGTWLDSHSGPMPDALAARVREVVKSLPNLGAMNFEIYDTFLARLDNATYDRIVDDMRALWGETGQSRSDAPPVTVRKPTAAPIAPADWEETVTEATWRAAPDKHPWPEDRNALELYATLARSFRGSMITRAMPRTIRYGLLRDGMAFDSALRAFFDQVPPQLYAPLEAEAFAEWWQDHDSASDPLMQALMSYDLAFLRLLSRPEPQLVRFPGNPAPVFEALAEARKPPPPEPPEWEIEILPDALTGGEFAPAMSAS